MQLALSRSIKRKLQNLDSSERTNEKCTLHLCSAGVEKNGDVKRYDLDLHQDCAPHRFSQSDVS
jgi:hypothetical protein